MSGIEDFTGAEIKIVEATLQERYGKSTSVQQADTELHLDPTVPRLTLSSAVLRRR